MFLLPNSHFMEPVIGIINRVVGLDGALLGVNSITNAVALIELLSNPPAFSVHNSTSPSTRGRRGMNPVTLLMILLICGALGMTEIRQINTTNQMII